MRSDRRALHSIESALVSRRLAAVASILFAVGCGASQSGPVDLGDEWAAEPGAFEDVTERWTREASLRSSLAGPQLLEVRATLLSPQWRSAYVQWRSARTELGAEARDALVAEQRAAAESHVEVILVVSTYHREHNDLQRGERSIWSLTLEAADGTQLPATSVVRDRRPRDVVATEVPEVPAFAETYVARFPTTPPVFGAGNDRVTLIMASNLGTVSLTWRGR